MPVWRLRPRPLAEATRQMCTAHHACGHTMLGRHSVASVPRRSAGPAHSARHETTTCAAHHRPHLTHKVCCHKLQLQHLPQSAKKKFRSHPHTQKHKHTHDCIKTRVRLETHCGVRHVFACVEAGRNDNQVDRVRCLCGRRRCTAESTCACVVLPATSHCISLPFGCG